MRNAMVAKSVLATAVMAAHAATPVQAQTQLNAGVLEEIVVTAQVREESLQDVPVSVNAVSGEKMFEAGIDRVEDLQAYVPNLSMSETGIGTNVYIRGIGSGINQGFEQSVGMYVDGVYFGRGQLSRAPFLDLQRVEVLRGPQNILYGKNSIAGALSIVTEKPTDEFEGMVSALYEPEHDEQVYDVVLSGPIVDTVGARLAYRNRTMDGWIENMTLNRDEPERDEETVRLSLSWQPVEELSAVLKYEHGEFDVTGRQVEIVTDRPSLNPLATVNPLTGQPVNYSEALFGFGADSSILNTRQDYKRSSNGDYSDNETDNVTLTLNYDMNGYTLTSITSQLDYEYEELCDCDFTAAKMFEVLSDEDYSQFSQEFRIVSPTDSTLDWIAGAYYQDNELEFNDAFSMPNGGILPNVLDFVLAQPTSPFGGTYPAGSAQQLTGMSAPRVFTQDTELWSAFGQVTWHIQDNLHLTVGGRYSEEEKDGYRSLTFVDANGVVIPYDPTFIPVGNPFGAPPTMGFDYMMASVFKAVRHDGSAPGAEPVLSGSRDESKFAPAVTVEFELNDDMMLYASWAQGFKSGGYDARSNTIDSNVTKFLGTTVPAGSFEYEDEEAETIELGAKMTLAGGAAELNVAVFQTEYTDLQMSLFDGVVGFNVGNAAEATTQGVELDGRWMVTDKLTLSGALALLDFEFDEYPNGQCTQLERIATTQIFCDFAGKTNQYVADWSGNVSADYHTPLTQSLQLRMVLDVLFTDDYNPSQNLDPIIEQDGYTKVNARIALSDRSETWEVALVGKNLTDEEVISYANDTPLSANLFQSIGHYAFIERDQTVALQGTYRF